MLEYIGQSIDQFWFKKIKIYVLVLLFPFFWLRRILRFNCQTCQIFFVRFFQWGFKQTNKQNLFLLPATLSVLASVWVAKSGPSPETWHLYSPEESRETFCKTTCWWSVCKRWKIHFWNHHLFVFKWLSQFIQKPTRVSTISEIYLFKCIGSPMYGSIQIIESSHG